MARRRNSPAPERTLPEAASDNDSLISSDGDSFLDDDDPQAAVNQPPQSAWTRFWSRFQSDPHAPRSIPLTRRQAKRQRRRQRRAERKARRRGSKLDTESSTLYDAGGAEEAYRDDSSATWSDEDYPTTLRRETHQPHHRRRVRIALCTILAIAIVSIVIFLLMGLSDSRVGSERAPITKPSILYNNGSSNFGPTTILVSLDGFRADFLNLGITPSLSSFVSAGVSPKYMLPSFPSVTFPNHWTLVTGLHPESHGIVGNSFWDVALGEEFYYTDPARSMFPKWWGSTGVEPLWGVAERQGIRSAVHMWPGSEAGLQPEPFHLDKFNQNEKLSNKVTRVLSWIDLPSPFDTTDGTVDQSLTNPRPQFISMYVPDVDSNGHKFGPNATEVHDTVTQVDEMVGQLLTGLEARNLTGIVNVVVVSDHGMASTSRERLIQYEDLVNPDDIDQIHGWPLYGLRPKAHVDLKGLYQDIKAKETATANSGWTVHNKETMPERWHFTANPRIAPIFLIPDAGWSIVTKDEMDLSNPANANAVYHPAGIHGYDNEHPLMRAIFVARGPAFPHPPGSRIKPFQNTEVYGIVAQSLGVKPMANNGTLSLPLSVQGIHGDGGEGDVIDHDIDKQTDSEKPPATPDQPEDSKADGKPESEHKEDEGSGKDDDKDSKGESGNDIDGESPSNDGDKDNGEDGKDELKKAKSKIKHFWDKLRQGFDKVKGWISDKFGAKKKASSSSGG